MRTHQAYSALMSSEPDSGADVNDGQNNVATPPVSNGQDAHDATLCRGGENATFNTIKRDIEESEIVEVKPHAKGITSDWSGSWIVEVGAAALSVVGFTLLIFFLIKIDGTPYVDWQYTISPNAVVSTIVATIKAALLVPVSACLSQLKWNQYSNSAPLYHLQALDQASRGPLGALQMLWVGIRGLRMGSLTFIGAIITVLALAIDPFAQQILVFPSRTIQAINETAWAQATQQYNAKLGLWDDDPHTVLEPSILSSILSGLAQSNAPLEPHCGSGNCNYPAFVTLGVCSDCADVTDRTRQTCQGEVRIVNIDEETDHIEFPNCTYATPSGFTIKLGFDDIVTDTPDYESQSPWHLEHWSSHPKKYDVVPDSASPIISLVAVNQSLDVYYNPSNSTVPPPIPSLTECTLYYCEREYPSSSYLAHNNPSYSIHVTNTQRLFPLIDDDILTVYFEPPNGSETLSTKNASYSIDSMGTFWPLATAINDVLNTTTNIHGWSQPSTLSLTQILRNGDLGKLLDSMSTSITDALRANARDNNNVSGKAFKVETFIEVRWPWIVLPICAILGSIILLLGTAVASKRQHAVLWKCSVIPLLMSRLETIPDHDMASMRNVDEVQRIAKKIEVRMEDQDGPLVFIED